MDLVSFTRPRLSRTDVPELGRRLDHTAERLTWLLEGLEESPEGYRGYIFAGRGHSRAAQEERIRRELSALLKNPVMPEHREEIDRTVHRLSWYLRGLEEGPEGYRGRIFTARSKRRAAQEKRIARELRAISKMKRAVH